ncbi:MAG: KTSC domain-containing protein [Candidatus Lokiarchaeota archaeon]|nr:KTSC domain-containing protein [Candidatus Lokiarchaeota archaeon]
MNWYKKAQKTSVPIVIMGYSPEHQILYIKFKQSPQTYGYRNVSPYFYEKINTLLNRNNFKEAAKMLRALAESNKSEQQQKQIISPVNTGFKSRPQKSKFKQQELF